MTRYIDADKLSASITSAIELSEKIGSDTHSKQRMQYAIALQKVNKIIKEYPAADVQPVVHCKDCKYYENTGIGTYCFNDFWGLNSVAYPLENDFCSKGDKLDGDEHD